jgi:hypothetical protein
VGGGTAVKYLPRTAPILVAITFALIVGLALAAGCRAETPGVDAAITSGYPPRIGDCEILPADNPLNIDISAYPVHPNSDVFIANVGLEKNLHPDFGTVSQGAPTGIPYVAVSGDQPKVPMTFEYADESEPGPYPIPDDAPIEGGPDSDGDRHILVVDVDNCTLYEVWHARRTEEGWSGGSGAIFDLTTNKLRPLGWTSSDAAGLPIFPALVKYEEVEQGEINHALRFTVRRSQRGYILPATHFASRSSDPDLMPMGLRLRLRADYDISEFPPQAQVILKALKKYGMIMADNGGDWFVSGAPSPKWDDEQLTTLKRVKGKDLEVVDTGPIITG